MNEKAGRERWREKWRKGGRKGGKKGASGRRRERSGRVNENTAGTDQENLQSI